MSGAGEAAAIEVIDLCKTFGRRRALDRVRMSVAPGEMVALIGPSGSGKSTLLRHIAGLIPADQRGGEVRVLGRSVQRSGRVARNIRPIRSRIGFVFQQFNLVGRLSLLTNTLIGMLSRVPTWRSAAHLFTTAEKRTALAALQRVGIADYAGQRASTLSGGQQQRGAIARAMVQRAEVILADEPIASLDPESSHRVLESLAGLNAGDGVTVLVSLHQIEYAFRYCPRTVALKDGLVVYDGPTKGLTQERLRSVYGARVAEFSEEAAVGAAASSRFSPSECPTHSRVAVEAAAAL
ncbi:MAG: phosphonate ABC transporter ATP-binding protein [Candidatus Methylomirabilia bacterium]